MSGLPEYKAALAQIHTAYGILSTDYVIRVNNATPTPSDVEAAVKATAALCETSTKLHAFLTQKPAEPKPSEEKKSITVEVATQLHKRYNDVYGGGKDITARKSFTDLLRNGHGILYSMGFDYYLTGMGFTPAIVESDYKAGNMASYRDKLLTFSSLEPHHNTMCFAMGTNIHELITRAARIHDLEEVLMEVGSSYEPLNDALSEPGEFSGYIAGYGVTPEMVLMETTQTKSLMNSLIHSYMSLTPEIDPAEHAYQYIPYFLEGVLARAKADAQSA